MHGSSHWCSISTQRWTSFLRECNLAYVSPEGVFIAMMQGRCTLMAIQHLPEAQEMVQSMLAAQPAKRPTMQGIMEQPFWWSPARRLAFLIHLSDRVETEDREVCKFLKISSRHF